MSNRIEIIPVVTQTERSICVNSKWPSKFYFHPMNIFAGYGESEGGKLLTLNSDDTSITLVENIQKLCNPVKIERVQNTEIFILLYDNKEQFLDSEYGKSKVSAIERKATEKDNVIWKWRIFNHFFSPWDIDEDEDDEELRDDYEEDEKKEFEKINVFDFILDENKFNPFHLQTRYVSHGNIEFTHEENGTHDEEHSTHRFITLRDICTVLA